MANTQINSNLMKKNFVLSFYYPMFAITKRLTPIDSNESNFEDIYDQVTI